MSSQERKRSLIAPSVAQNKKGKPSKGTHHDIYNGLYAIYIALGMKTPDELDGDYTLQSIMSDLPKILKQIQKRIKYIEDIHCEDMRRGNILATALRSLMERQYKNDIGDESDQTVQLAVDERLKKLGIFDLMGSRGVKVEQ